MLKGIGMAAAGPDPSVAVLRLRGENDASVAHRVRSDLTSAVNGDAPVVVDLTAATSLDAAVVRILLDALAACEARERLLVLLLPAAGDSPVRRLFEITGLAGLLPIASSWDEVLSRVSRAQVAAPGWTSPVS
jgi:anti-anti-sigma factor